MQSITFIQTDIRQSQTMDTTEIRFNNEWRDRFSLVGCSGS